jgi:hypothetical protein
MLGVDGQTEDSNVARTIMILGLSVSAFTTLHVIISLVAIGVGIVVMAAMARGHHLSVWVAIFLGTTILTSVTGYFFPASGVTPGHIVGAISLVALLIAVAALSWFDLRGGWRVAYVVTTALALYLNAFVGVVQAFQKIPPLAQLAPTQTEAPFVVAQCAVLAVMLVAGWLAVRRFRPHPG